MSTSLANIPITERPDVVALLDKVPLTPAEQSAQKAFICCVTGATGMVGSHVARRLLRAKAHGPCTRAQHG